MTEICYAVFNTTFTKQSENPAIISSIYIGYGLLGIVGVVLNFLIIYTIWKSPIFHKPSYVLLGSLALGDLLACLVVDPLYAITNEAVLKRKADVFCEYFISSRLVGYWIGAVSLYSLTVISIDRLLAIKMKIKYRMVVTLKRVISILVFGWTGSGILFIVIRVNLDSMSVGVNIILALIAIFILLTTITASYLMAFYFLKKLTKISPQSLTSNENTEQTSTFNVSNYRRSLKTMLIVFLTILLFYSSIFWCSLTSLVLMNKYPESIDALNDVYILLTSGETLVLFNSTINPLLYLWRMKDLCDGVKTIIKGMKCIHEKEKVNISQGKSRRADTIFSNT